MKRLLLLILMVALFVPAMKADAQAVMLSNKARKDSVVTSSSKDTASKLIPVTAGYSAYGIQVVATKVSGTVAGKAYLYATIDGTNWKVIDSSSAFTDVATNVAFFTPTSLPYAKYRVDVRTADGTASTQRVGITVWINGRKFNQ